VSQVTFQYLPGCQIDYQTVMSKNYSQDSTVHAQMLKLNHRASMPHWQNACLLHQYSIWSVHHLDLWLMTLKTSLAMHTQMMKVNSTKN